MSDVTMQIKFTAEAEVTRAEDHRNTEQQEEA